MCGLAAIQRRADDVSGSARLPGNPKDLWGGVGPRDGWLLLFMAACMDPDDIDHACDSGPLPEPPFRFLHLPEDGPERTIALAEESIRGCVWLRREYSETVPVSATPFQRIPVVFENVSGAPEWGENCRPPRPATRPQSAEAAHPVTWDVFEKVIGALYRELDRKAGPKDRYMSSRVALIERLRSPVDKYEGLAPAKRRHWHEHQFAQAINALSLLEKELAGIPVTRRAIDEIVAERYSSWRPRFQAKRNISSVKSFRSAPKNRIV